MTEVSNMVIASAIILNYECLKIMRMFSYFLFYVKITTCQFYAGMFKK